MYLEQASAICSKINFLAPQIEFTKYLSEAYALSGNHRKALEVYKLSESIKDSVFSLQNRMKISDLETQRELDVKDKIITIRNKEFEIAKLVSENNRNLKVIYIAGITLLLLILAWILKKYSDRKKAHRKEISDTEARLRRTQAIAHLGNWDLNMKTGITLMSDEACRIYGIPLNENKKYFETWFQFIHPDDIDYVREKVNESRDKLSEFGIFHRIIRQDGEIRFVYTEGHYELDKNNQPKYIFGIVFDNTRIREHEIELQKLLNTSNQQNDRLKDFAYIVSHNIRSHSANIHSIIDFMQQKNDLDTKSKLFGMLSKSSQKLLDTIDNLNEIITIQSSIIENYITLNLRDEINKVCENLNTEIVEANANIINIVPHDIHLNTVPAYLKSILFNILSNAIRYRFSGRPLEISISAEIKDNNVLLIFEDNGTGIDLKKNGKKMFGLYKTFHGNQDAIGFGLYLTKNHIETMGGSIEVESTPDSGSKFKLYFKIL